MTRRPPTSPLFPYTTLFRSVWTTDKDGLLLCLLAAEITAVTSQTPSQRYARLVERFGNPAYARVDAPATREQKATLGALTPSADRKSTRLNSSHMSISYAVF